MTRPFRSIFTNGFPEYRDTFWDDLRFPVQGINPPGAVSDPTRDTNDGTLLFSASATNLIAGIAQMPHAWLLGSAVSPHIHWSPTNTNTGNVLWRFEWQLAAINSAFSGVWTADNVLDAGDGVAEKHQLMDWADLDMSTISTVSAIIKWRVSRIGGDASDTYNAVARLLEVDFHYQIDRPGSRSEYVK